MFCGMHSATPEVCSSDSSAEDWVRRWLRCLRAVLGGVPDGATTRKCHDGCRHPAPHGAAASMPAAESNYQVKWVITKHVQVICYLNLVRWPVPGEDVEVSPAQARIKSLYTLYPQWFAGGPPRDMARGPETQDRSSDSPMTPIEIPQRRTQNLILADRRPLARCLVDGPLDPAGQHRSRDQRHGHKQIHNLSARSAQPLTFPDPFRSPRTYAHSPAIAARLTRCVCLEAVVPRRWTHPSILAHART